jgi:hypothetical protein
MFENNKVMIITSGDSLDNELKSHISSDRVMIINIKSLTLDIIQDYNPTIIVFGSSVLNEYSKLESVNFVDDISGGINLFLQAFLIITKYASFSENNIHIWSVYYDYTLHHLIDSDLLNPTLSEFINSMFECFAIESNKNIFVNTLLVEIYGNEVDKEQLKLKKEEKKNWFNKFKLYDIKDVALSILTIVDSLSNNNHINGAKFEIASCCMKLPRIS